MSGALEPGDRVTVESVRMEASRRGRPPNSGRPPTVPATGTVVEVDPADAPTAGIRVQLDDPPAGPGGICFATHAEVRRA